MFANNRYGESTRENDIQFILSDFRKFRDIQIMGHL